MSDGARAKLAGFLIVLIAIIAGAAAILKG
jgi:hypothetical protein